MSNLPDSPRPPQSRAGWWPAAAALFVGYLLGQTSGSTAVTNTAAPVDYGAAAAAAPALDNLDLNSTGPVSTPEVASDAPAVELPDTDATGSESDDESTDVAASDDVDAAGSPRIAASTPEEDPSLPSTAVASTEDDSLATPTATSPQLNSYAPSNAPAFASGGPACSESGSCYGDISATTGLPKTTYVHGYFRKSGTYVRSYYRSHH